MRKNIRVKPRFWLFLMVLFFIVFTPIYFIMDAYLANLEATHNRLIALGNEYRAQASDLRDDLAYLKTPEGIEQYARAQGMIMEGEVPYKAAGSAN